MLASPRGESKAARLGYEIAVHDVLCWLSAQGQGGGTV
jgi:hypothetical protein